jgi:signal transduction histidine kinase
MEKENDHLFLFIRYSIFFCISLSIVTLNNNEKLNILGLVIYLLIYIINTQLRIYFLTKYRLCIIISLLFEIFVIYLLYNSFKGFTFIYFFVTIIDASTMLENVDSIIMNIILFFAVMLISLHPDYSNLQNHMYINVIFNMLVVLGFSSLGKYIKTQSEKKFEAQKLYDKIRLSEEKLKEAYERLESYSSTVEEITILKERNRISREIHDTAGHTLSTLIIQLQAVPFLWKSNPTAAEEMINNMLSYTKTGLEDVRRAVRELSPSAFDKNSGVFLLKELIINFQKNSNVKVDFNVSKTDYDLNSDQSFTLYRVFQESFSNSIRHGGATKITINMSFSANEIYVHIRDNGTCPKNVEKGFGLTNMEKRITFIGGTFSHMSHEDQGFEINILIPKNQNIAELKEDKDE